MAVMSLHTELLLNNKGSGKDAMGNPAFKAGEVALFNLFVENNGESAQEKITLTEGVAADFTGYRFGKKEGYETAPDPTVTVAEDRRSATIENLAPGVTVEIDSTYTVTEEDIKSTGAVGNFITVDGQNPDNPTPSVEIPIERTYQLHTEMSVVNHGTGKTFGGKAAFKENEVADFEIKIKNTGQLPQSRVQILENIRAYLDSPSYTKDNPEAVTPSIVVSATKLTVEIDVLDPGVTAIVHAHYTLTKNDIDGLEKVANSISIRGDVINVDHPDITVVLEVEKLYPTYTVYVPMDGYYTSQDALDRVDHFNRKMTITAGEWYIYNQVEGALALSKKPGENYGGGWINVADNEANANKNNTTDDSSNPADPSNTDTTSGYYSDVQTKDFAKDSRATPLQMPPGTTCYIINLVTGTQIHFHLPESVADAVAANFDPIDIRGRSNALQGFNTTGPRTVSFDFDLHRDFCEYGLVTTAAQLKALCYPGYVGYIDAPKAYIHLGNAVRGLFIVNDVSVTYNVPYMDDMYMTAQVSMSVTEAGDTVYSASQIEEGYGMDK